MKCKSLLVLSVALVAVVPASAHGKKKSPPDRAMLEKMDAVPCGASQKGVTGVGSIWASVGITKMSSDEKLCPRYLLRTDEMEYEIQPHDRKHPTILPVGQEVVFKIKNDHMTVRNPQEDKGADKKARDYEVVAIKPTEHDADTSSAKNGGDR